VTIYNWSHNTAMSLQRRLTVKWQWSVHCSTHRSWIPF